MGTARDGSAIYVRDIATALSSSKCRRFRSLVNDGGRKQNDHVKHFKRDDAHADAAGRGFCCTWRAETGCSRGHFSAKQAPRSGM